MQLQFKDTFKPKYAGKIFTVTPANLTYEIEIPVDPITDEGKAIKKLTETLWAKEMQKFRATKEKEYAAAIAETERNIYKSLAKRAKTEQDPKKLEAWLNEEVKGANVMIAGAIKTLESLVSSKAEEVYKKAAEAVDKKYNAHLRQKKIKAGLRIAGHVALILVAGALAIAAGAAGVAITALTAGAGSVSFVAVAPVVLGALVTVVKSGKAIHSTVQKEWPTCEKALDQLGKSTEALIKSVEYQNKKRAKQDLTGKLGPKERIKLFLNDIKGDVKAVESSLNNCRAYSVTLSQKIELLANRITEFQKPIDDLHDAAKKDPDSKQAKQAAAEAQKLVTQQVKALQKLGKARDFVKQLNPAIVEGEKLVASTDVEDVAKLKGFLGKVQKLANNQSLNEAITETTAVINGVITLVKVLK